MSNQQPAIPGEDLSVLPNLCRDRSVFFLVVVAQLFVVLLVLADQGSGLFDWHRLANMTIHVQWVCLMSAAMVCWTRQLLARRSNAQKLAIAYAICVINGVVVSLIGQWVLNEGVIDPSVVVRHTLMTLLVALLVLRYFYLQFLLVRQSKAELSSRLQALHSRIRPHFLFNSLNSVASLIPVNPQQAEQAVEDLADIFRATLKQSFDLVPLTEEITLCKRYLSLESLRLGTRLQVVWHEHADLSAWLVPQLTLQPLLENAIVHGIQHRTEGGEIHIHIHDSEKQLKVTLTNPVPQQGPTGIGNQLGVENIQDRLQVVFGDQARVQGMVRDGQYVCVVNIPRQARQAGQ